MGCLPSKTRAARPRSPPRSPPPKPEPNLQVSPPPIHTHLSTLRGEDDDKATSPDASPQPTHTHQLTLPKESVKALSNDGAAQRALAIPELVAQILEYLPQANELYSALRVNSTWFHQAARLLWAPASGMVSGTEPRWSPLQPLLRCVAPDRRQLYANFVVDTLQLQGEYRPLVERLNWPRAKRVTFADFGSCRDDIIAMASRFPNVEELRINMCDKNLLADEELRDVIMRLDSASKITLIGTCHNLGPATFEYLSKRPRLALLSISRTTGMGDVGMIENMGQFTSLKAVAFRCHVEHPALTQVLPRMTNTESLILRIYNESNSAGAAAATAAIFNSLVFLKNLKALRIAVSIGNRRDTLDSLIRETLMLQAFRACRNLQEFIFASELEQEFGADFAAHIPFHSTLREFRARIRNAPGLRRPVSVEILQAFGRCCRRLHTFQISGFGVVGFDQLDLEQPCLFPKLKVVDLYFQESTQLERVEKVMEKHFPLIPSKVYAAFRGWHHVDTDYDL